MSASTPLSHEAIHSTLATRALGHSLYLHRELSSTNKEAGVLLQQGAAHGTTVVAESQSGGYGRHGRAWYSPAGFNIYCSIILREGGAKLATTEWLPWVPLVTALAVTEATQQIAAVSLRLKWPNDLLLDDRKVGGILCESTLTPMSGPIVIIGIGLNVNVPRVSFPEELRPIAASLIEASHRPIDRNRLIAQLLWDLEQCLDELQTNGANRLRQAYIDRCVTLRRQVKVLFANDRHLLGTAEGLSADGALQVRPLWPHLPSQLAPLIDVRAADVLHLRE